MQTTAQLSPDSDLDCNPDCCAEMCEVSFFFLTELQPFQTSVRREDE